jgi:uncharacterized protein (TIGR02265 family)
MTAVTPRKTAIDPLTELAQRLGLAERKDSARGMFFLGALDVVRQEAGPAAAARCLIASRERFLVPFFLYPIAGFLRLSFSAAGLLAPKLGSFDLAMKCIGARATHDFLDSAVGRQLLAHAAGEPRRLVESLPGGYRSAVSYGERHVSWTGERQACLTMIRDFMPPPYHEGVLQAVLEAIGTRGTRVHGRPLSLLNCEYVLSWDG